MAENNQMLEELLAIVVREGASDLHITSGMFPNIRVAGDLVPLVSHKKLTDEDTKALVYSLLRGEENIKEFEANHDSDFSYMAKDGSRFRCNSFYQRGSIGAALRLIPKTTKTFEELSLPPILKDFAYKQQGFFLVVGPVGQGKSTTLAAMVELVNHTRAAHIITVEDPIEYIFTNDKSIIDQREVRYDTKSFETALRSMFRQDVDIGMIGEMRSAETISTAVTAAETGHLIFSTLHTNNASQTIDRIIDAFPGDQQDQIRLQLAGSLIGVFSQRLVPKISGGLVPAYELLINNKAVANLIRERRTAEIDIVIETSSQDGMIDMNHCLAELVQRGEITPENALQFATNRQAIERLL